MREFIFSMKALKEYYRNIIFVMIFLLISLACDANAVRDYEWQLNHVEKNLIRELVQLSRNKETTIKLSFLAKDIKHINSLKHYYKTYDLKVEEGEWLSYSYKLSVSFKLKLNEVEFKKWLRLQFFIGIANYCDLDGVIVGYQKSG